MPNFGIAVSGVALLLAGCASTGNPKDLGTLEYTGFTEKSDGTAFQSVMGLSCPSEIRGIPRTSTHVYNDGGTDISCNYSKDGRILTVYLSRYLNDTIDNNFVGAKMAIENRFEPQGYEYDEELSGSCSSQSIDSRALMSGLSGLLSGTNTSKNVTISTTPSAVYSNETEGKMTLVVVDEIFDKEFFKTRYTGPYSGVDDVENICKAVRENFLNLKSSIGKTRGYEPSDTDKLLGLINAPDGDS